MSGRRCPTKATECDHDPAAIVAPCNHPKQQPSCAWCISRRLAKERDDWRSAALAQRSLAVCLRVGRPPSQQLWAQLERAKKTFELHADEGDK